MKTSNDPNVETLAMLASQSRFANLTPAPAVRAALTLWLECQAVLEKHSDGVNRKPEQPASMPEQIQKPSQWPIQLHEFYRLVVKGRDEGASEKRLMRFLPLHLLTAVGMRDKSIQERTTGAKKRIADWRVNGLTEPHWDWLAPAFSHWWQNTGRLEGKRQGGKTRATQRKK